MIEFLEEIHTYLKDGMIVPSVSEILHFIFPDKYKNVSKEILNKKAQYGTKIHEVVEFLEQDKELPKLSNIEEFSIRQYKRLKAKYQIEVLEQEQIISYEYHYCGRFDMIAKIGEDTCLCDIKTTAELDREYLSWQLSFYELATGKTFDKLYAIWLPKKNLGELIEIKRKTKEELLEKIKEFENERNIC